MPALCGAQRGAGAESKSVNRASSSGAPRLRSCSIRSRLALYGAIMSSRACRAHTGSPSSCDAPQTGRSASHRHGHWHHSCKALAPSGLAATSTAERPPIE